MTVSRAPHRRRSTRRGRGHRRRPAASTATGSARLDRRPRRAIRASFRLDLHRQRHSDAQLQRMSAGTLGPMAASSRSGMSAACPTAGGRRDPRAHTAPPIVALTRPDAPGREADLVLAVALPEDASDRVGAEAHLAQPDRDPRSRRCGVAMRRGRAAPRRPAPLQAAAAPAPLPRRRRAPRRSPPARRTDASMPAPSAGSGHTTLLRGGTIIDGTGAPRCPATCASTATASRRSVRRRRRSPAPGDRRPRQVVAPGFIDVHTHDDRIVLEAPRCCPRSARASPRWSSATAASASRRCVHGDAPPPLNLLGGTAKYLHPTLCRLCRGGRRGAAGGQRRGAGRPFVAADRDDGRSRSAGDARRAGAHARAAARGPGGRCDRLQLRPVLRRPARPPTSTSWRCSRGVAGAAGGIYTTHMRNEGDICSLPSTRPSRPRGAALPVVISHHKCAGPATGAAPCETLALIDAAREAPADRARRLPLHRRLDRAARADLVDGIIDIMVTWSEPHPEMAARDLADIARGVGLHQQEACDAAAARRRLLFPDARGRRAARAALSRDDDRLRRAAA